VVSDATNCGTQLNTLQTPDHLFPMSYVTLPTYYKCCGRAYLTLASLQQHKHLVHQESKEEVTFRCASCPKKFRSSMQFTEHLLREHYESHVCPHCHLLLASPRSYRRHCCKLHKVYITSLTALTGLHLLEDRSEPYEMFWFI